MKTPRLSWEIRTQKLENFKKIDILTLLIILMLQFQNIAILASHNKMDSLKGLYKTL